MASPNIHAFKMDSFFDIPVYRISPDKYEVDQNAQIDSQMCPDETMKEFYKRNPDQDQNMRHHFWRRYGGPWQFNEIIGYIRLHFLGTQIRGEWWRVEAKVIRRTRKKMLVMRNWKVVYEEEIPEGSSSDEIYRLILRYLRRAQEDKELKRFYIDTSVLTMIGPYVDWEAAFKALNSSKARDIG